MLSHHQKRSPRAAWIWIAAVVLLVAGPLGSTVSAADDPIDRLRQILAMSKPPDDVDFVKRRDAMIQASMAELDTIPLLRRAYFLSGWWTTGARLELLPKEDELSPYQVEIGKKLVDAIRKTKQVAVADKASPDDAVRQASQVKRLAVAMLLAELAQSEPATERKRDKFARKLTDVAVELCADSSVAVKQTALHALGRMTPPPEVAIRVLQARVRDRSEPGPRRVAAYALIDLIKNGPSLSKLDQVLTIQGVLQTAKWALDDDSAEEEVRGYALLAIRDAARSLEEWYQTLDLDDREAALGQELHRAIDACELVSPSLGKALDNAPSNIRVAAMDALVQFAQLRAKLLIRFPSDKQAGKNGAKATDPLGSAGFEARLREVAAVLESRDAEVRQRRGALAFLDLLAERSKPALPQITAALRDSDGLVRYTAARAIRHFPFKGDRKIAPVPEETVVALGALTLDADPDINAAAFASLEALGPFASPSIENLSKAVSFGDIENRVNAMKLIGSLGTPSGIRAYPAVIEMLGSEDHRATRQAAETLGQMGAVGRKEERNPNPALQALLHSFRAAALPALTKALRDPDPETRLNASEAILTIPDLRKGL